MVMRGIRLTLLLSTARATTAAPDPTDSFSVPWSLYFISGPDFALPL
jgi:hypothetical protein